MKNNEKSIRTSSETIQVLKKIKDEIFKQQGYTVTYSKLIEIMGLKFLEDLLKNNDLK
jgi:hypothetical protein